MVYAYFAAFRKDVEYKSYVEYSDAFDFGKDIIHKFTQQ